MATEAKSYEHLLHGGSPRRISISSDDGLEYNEGELTYFPIHRESKRRMLTIWAHGTIILIYTTIFALSWIQLRETYQHGPGLIYSTLPHRYP